ncbi:MAG: 50S ribosomal protein L3 N(5)-glutamine methyltransferase [Pseudomonadota bacterium]
MTSDILPILEIPKPDMQKIDARAPVEELLTVRDFLRWTLSRLQSSQVYLGHGTDDLWDEALHLVLHALHLDLTVDDRILDARLLTKEREHIVYLVKQRIEQKIPTPYLTQTAWLDGLSFFVDERVLIPRSPIAEIISQQFQPWIESDRVDRILDLCTGSGCLAILAQRQFPEAEVWATDLSPDALIVAQKNCDRHDYKELLLIESDGFDKIPKQAFDVIVCNPPYVPKKSMQSLPEEYQHEPVLALVAGDDGLSVVRKILPHVVDYLAPGGILILEVGEAADALEQAFNWPWVWLDLEQGGEGVCVIQREQIESALMV